MGAMAQLVLPPVKPLLVEEYDTDNRSFVNQWAWGKIFSTHHFRARSRIKITLHIPARNDTTNWGGLYTEVYVDLNGGGWVSLGHSGYDAVMSYSARLVATYSKSFLYDPEQAQDFTLRLGLQHRSYNGTTHVNANHGFVGERFGTTVRLEEVLA